MDFLMRSTPTFGLMKPQIDRSENVIRNVVGMTAYTEALGHHIMADTKCLEQFVDQGNARKNGVRGRFGHPGISEQSTGKQVQIARNFRVNGDKLVHDMHLVNFARKSPAFSQDPLEYIFDVAENHPSEIGESVVAAANLVWVMGEGDDAEEIELTDREYHEIHFGPLEAPDGAIYKWPVMRLREGGFKYIDVVSEGALTHDGLFEANLSQLFEGHSSQYALELFSLIDRWRKQYNIPLSELELKSKQLLEKYLFSRSRKEDDMSITDDAITRRSKTRNLGKQALALEAQPTPPDPEVEEEDVVEEEQEQEFEADTEPAPEAEPVTPPTPQPAGTEISASGLDAAEKTMQALAESQGRQEAEQDRFAILADRVTQLSEKVDKLSVDLVRAGELIANQAEWMGKLASNVVRIDGERVVKEQVPRFATNPHDRLDQIPSPQEMLTPQQEQHPVPALNQFSAAIDGTPEGLILATDTPQTAAQKAIQNQNRRQRAYRLQGSQNLPR